MSPAKPHPAMRVMFAVIFIALILTAASASSSVNASAKEREVSPETMVAYMGSPAVVKVSTTYLGQLLGPSGAKVFLYSNMRGMLNETQIAEVQIAPVDIPQFSAGGTGTGFVISSDGYIMTNAHVVYMSEEELKDDFVDQAADWAAQEWPTIFSNNGYEPYPQTSEDIWWIKKFFNNYYKASTQEPIIYVYFGNPRGIGTSPEGHPASIAKKDPVEMKYSNDMKYRYRSGKDIAILKVEGVRNLLNVPMGDSDRVQVGEKAVVIGYPGIAESGGHSYLSSKSDLVPTVTSGIISARKKLPDDSDIFQTDAGVTHGNSGGPAFNDKGEVIGVATFGSYTYLEGGVYSEVAGFNFLIPINVAKRFVTELNINTTPSRSTQHMEKGLDYYWNNSYSLAEQEFAKIGALNDVDRYAAEYGAMARRG